MKKIILFTLLFFPTLAFGQNHTGNYRAIFFNLFSEQKTIIAEFEVKSDNSIIGKVKVGDEIKLFKGAVDKKGKFEAVSQIEENSVYELKGKFDKENKISFIRRIEERSSGSKSISENGLEGTFAKVEKVENAQTLTDTDFSVIDNGKSQLFFQHSNQLFGNQWVDFVGNVAFKVSEGEKRMELTASVSIDQQKRSIRIYTKPMFPDQKIWKTTDLQTASYREEIGNPDEKNTFLTAGLMYLTDQSLQNGRLEIVKETEIQIIFKLANFKIKRFIKEDVVEINGFIYANKAK